MEKQGLSKNTSLKHLSLCDCQLSAEDVCRVCRAVRNHPALRHLSFSSGPGQQRATTTNNNVVVMSNGLVDLIRHQKAIRSNQRNNNNHRRIADYDHKEKASSSFRGLSRLSLVDWPQFGTAGFRLLADNLLDSDSSFKGDRVNNFSLSLFLFPPVSFLKHFLLIFEIVKIVSHFIARANIRKQTTTRNKG
jgi:hypothetical protein